MSDLCAQRQDVNCGRRREDWTRHTATFTLDTLCPVLTLSGHALLNHPIWTGSFPRTDVCMSQLMFVHCITYNYTQISTFALLLKYKTILSILQFGGRASGLTQYHLHRSRGKGAAPAFICPILNTNVMK